MAEGLLRALSDHTCHTFSAGTMATAVRPEAVEVMREIGIDISNHQSKTLDQFVSDSFEIVITVCDSAAQSCPTFARAKARRHWSIDDPSAADGLPTERLARFRAARDELRQRIESDILPLLDRPDGG